MSENQISADSMYIENNKVFEISGIISDTKRIYAPYSIFDFCVKQEAREKCGFEKIKRENP